MRQFRYLVVTALLFILAACNTVSTPEQGMGAQGTTGRYIVVLKQGAAPGGHAAN